MNDRDGDRACDEVDVCPDVADPGQADLDGDRIGWMCDPVETVTLQSEGFPPEFRASIHGDTFAASTRFACNGSACVHESVQVGPAGGIRVRSDSTAPADAWQAVPWLGGPVVTAEQRVLWSRGRDAGDTGDLDLASGVFTSRVNAVFLDNLRLGSSTLYAGTALVALELRAGPSSLNKYFVDVRADGSLPIVETAQGFEIISDDVMGGIPIPGATPRALVPLRVQFKYGLKLYTAGAASLSEIVVAGAPLAGLDELQPIEVDGFPRAFCAMRGGQAYDVQWNAAGEVVAYPLPLATCHRVKATDRGAVRIFYSDGSLAPSATAYLYNGQVHTLMVGEGPAWEILGAQLPVVLSTFDKVWRIAPDGTSSVLVSGGNGVRVSMAGDTIHVLVHRPYPMGPSGLGTWNLVRYRPNTPPVEAQIIADSYNGIGISMFTSAEGAALISSNAFPPNVVVPSQTTTPMPVTVGELRGGVRDGRTIVFTNQGSFTPGALYLYDEDAGMPRFTQLSAAASSMTGALVDSPDRSGPTSWFAYGNGTTGHHLARIKADGTLETFPSSGDAWAMRALGTTVDGALIVHDYTHVYALTSAGAAKIGAGATGAILDTSISPPLVVGWTGITPDNTRRFSCLASHPERCWDYSGGIVVTRADAFAGGGTGAFSLISRSFVPAGNSVDLTVVRSFGPGNFTPPP